MVLETITEQFPDTTYAKIALKPKTELSAKPFFQWVGGKRELLKRYPDVFPKTYNTYFEPFLGGGAVLYHLSPKQAFLSDINTELITSYNTVKNNVNAVIEVLEKLTQKHSKEFFYALRNIDRTEEWNKATSAEVTARFLYLNKAGFNALYRVNQKGQNNVPFGRSLNTILYNPYELKEASKFLKPHTFTNQPYTNIINSVQAGDFVYLDPPYAPVSKTSTFTSYSKTGFNWEDQKQVKELCDKINEKEAYFLLSNSNATELYDLYEDYSIKNINISRRVNSDPTKRGDVTEILVSNYKI